STLTTAPLAALPYLLPPIRPPPPTSPLFPYTTLFRSQAPPPADPLPILQSSPSVTGPFQDVSSASIDTTTRTVTVSVPPDIQFYRVQACDPLHSTSISISGANLVLTYE